MAKLSDGSNGDADVQQQQDLDRQKLQIQQEQYRQLQRDLADAISRLASLDDIRILLACGARVDGPVTQGLHPIHYAAYQNFVPAVRVSIRRFDQTARFMKSIVVKSKTNKKQPKNKAPATERLRHQCYGEYIIPFNNQETDSSILTDFSSFH